MVKNKKKLHEYVRRMGIKFIVLFGSRVNKTFREDSDYDLAVYPVKDKPMFQNFKKYHAVLDKLEKLLMLEYENIDLVDLRFANILLRNEITSKGKLLYGNKEQYEELRAFAYRDYLDAFPLFQLEDTLIRKRQAFIAKTLKTL